MHTRSSTANRRFGTAARIAVAAIVGASLTVVAAACDAGCTAPELQLSITPAAPGPTTPVTMRARLEGKGKALSGVRIHFDIAVAGTNAQHIPAGQSDTDRTGLATLSLPRGAQAITTPAFRVSGFEADFTSVTDIDGVNYCNAKSSRAIG